MLSSLMFVGHIVIRPWNISQDHNRYTKYIKMFRLGNGKSAIIYFCKIIACDNETGNWKYNIVFNAL